MPGPGNNPGPAMVHPGEVVLNKDQQRAMAARAGDTNNHFNITIEGGVFADGPSLDKLANALARRLTCTTGR